MSITNGSTATMTTGTAAAMPTADVDHLATLRAKIRELAAEEHALTAALTARIAASGGKRLYGARHVAVLDARTPLKVDPELLHEAAGRAAFGAMTVSVEKARTLLGGDDLAAIAEPITTPILRLEAAK